MTVFIADELAEVVGLSTLLVGAQYKLKMAMWLADDCSLPDDEGMLVAITGLTSALWRRHRGALQNVFTVEDGRWTHRKLQERQRQVRAEIKKNSELGTRLAHRRWHHDRRRQPPANDAHRNSAGSAGSSASRIAISESRIQKSSSCSEIHTDTARAECGDSVHNSERRVSDEEAMWAARVRPYKPGGFWPASWGPRPEEQGCLAPPQLLAEWRVSNQSVVPEADVAE